MKRPGKHLTLPPVSGLYEPESLASFRGWYRWIVLPVPPPKGDV